MSTPTELPAPAVYNVKQACAALNLGPNKLYSLLRSGELRGVKIGARTAIKPEEIQRFIDSLPEYRPMKSRGGA